MGRTKGNLKRRLGPSLSKSRNTRQGPSAFEPFGEDVKVTVNEELWSDPSAAADDLWNRYQETGDRLCLDEAILLDERAIQDISPDHPDYHIRLHSLGVCLLDRFQLSQNPADLEQALTHFEISIRSASSNDGVLSRYRINFGNALHKKFERSGVTTDLDAAIAQLELAQSSAPPTMLLDLCKGLLGRSLLTRAALSGSRNDRSRALSLMGPPPSSFPAFSARKRLRIESVGDLSGCIRKTSEFPLGVGGFADVYMGEWTTGDGMIRKVAIKVIRQNVIDNGNLKLDEKVKKRLSSEIEVWRQLQHPNVVQLDGVSYDFGPYPAMVSPWLYGGNLTNFLSRNQSLPLFRRLQLMQHVAAGLEYLHSRSVVHGDLSGPNILIDASGNALVSDFGLSVIAEELIPMSLTSTLGGSLRWAAQELHRYEGGDEGESRITKASDVYSFGSVALEILSGKLPYHYLKRDAEVLIQLSKGVLPQRPEEVADDYWAMINRCWSSSPPDRPSMDIVLVDVDRFNDEIFRTEKGETKNPKSSSKSSSKIRRGVPICKSAVVLRSTSTVLKKQKLSMGR